MGIYPQPNAWLCGPFALKHGLLMLGIVAGEDALARAAGTDETGTDETELARAARRHGAELRVERRHDPEAARRDLVSYLGQGLPNLLCVEEWNHWVAAVGGDGDRFVVLDSRDADVVRVLSWEQLRPVLAYTRGGRGDGAVYDLHPLLPTRPGPVRARFTVERGLALGRPANRSLARQWDRFVAALVGIVRGRTAGWDDLFARSLAGILREDASALARRLGAAGPDERTTRRYLEGLAFVAETYEVVVRSDQREAVLDGVTATFEWWVRGNDT